MSSILTAVGLGLGAGVNAYATLLVFGLFSRLKPGMFDSEVSRFFATTPALITLGVLYCVEFFADKFPTVDHVWDVIHTVVRPLAGAVVAFGSVTDQLPQGMIVLATVIGGGAALTSHVAKASLRATSTVTTGGVGNPILSVLEDVFAIGNAFAAILLPWIVLIVFALLIWTLLVIRGRLRRNEGLTAKG